MPGIDRNDAGGTGASCRRREAAYQPDGAGNESLLYRPAGHSGYDSARQHGLSAARKKHQPRTHKHAVAVNSVSTINARQKPLTESDPVRVSEWPCWAHVKRPFSF